MGHVFIIKKSHFDTVKEKPIEIVFKNYFDARKAAINIVKKEDLSNNVTLDFDPENQPTTIYKEVSPDMWLNKYGMIKIDYLDVKESIKSKKNRTQENQDFSREN